MGRVCSTPVSKTGDDLNLAVLQENARLRETLKYYADPKNYKLSGFNGVRRMVRLERDGGQKAREALGWN
ncbi:hypothetical protein OXB_2860 [Bacillus sp. OxB-1]|nr:hypothetical protein OXB_2860 [Bacillus sp. OxB-1]